MQTSENIHPDKQLSLGDQDKLWTPGAITDVKVFEEGAYVFETEKAAIMLQPVNEHIIRVKLMTASERSLKTTLAVQQEAFSSIPAELQNNESSYTLKLPAASVVIHKQNACIDVYNENGELVSSDVGLYSTARGKYGCRKQNEKHSHIYGLGEKTSFLDKAGEKYDMWNSDVFDPHVPEIECLYVSIPFFIHFNYEKAPYGIFLDNPGRTSFDFRSSAETYSFEVQSGELDYYVILGSSVKDIVSRYSSLTGRMDLPPAWAIGYHQSRYSYMSQEEVIALAHTFKEKHIPVDAIHLDIHYMDEYRVFTFDPKRFPNPRKMLDELNESGIRIVPIVDPGVKKDPAYKQYQDGIHNDYFCKKIEGDLFFGDVWPGKSAFPDFTEEEVRQWWGEQHRYYTELGIHGIWNDMNEPAVFNETKTMDLDVVHRNDGDPRTHGELHNLYGMLMSMATQQGLKEQLSGSRPFVLTRAGYAGVQKYAATWTGDNRSFWEHLAMSIPMVLNLGLSGQPFAGPDIGGFAHHATPELLARWTQAGVFFPYCRNHSVLDSIRQEPWAFGEEVEKICQTYIRMRYQFMPYLYTQFYEAHKTGLPIMRPLLMEYPEDRNVYNLCDQFLVGTDLLVAPILRPSTTARAVYLPAGEWIDYWTNEHYEGGQNILADAPLDRLPLYIRAGAVIPTLMSDEWKPQLKEGAVVKHVLYAAKAGSQLSSQWYEDDANTYDYEQGSSNLMQFTAAFEQASLALDVRYSAKGLPKQRDTVEIEIKGLPFEPTQITVGEGDAGGSCEWNYDAEKRSIVLLLTNDFDAAHMVIS